MISVRRLAVLLTLVGGGGCAGPFDAVKSSAAGAGLLTATYCGSSTYRADAIIRAMDGPPSGQESSTLAAPKEVTLCVKVDNGGAQPVTVDRSQMHLECPREKQPWIHDSEDPRFVVPPGATRQLKVTFHYSPLLSGEDVRLVFDYVFSRGERPVPVPPLVLRKR